MEIRGDKGNGGEAEKNTVSTEKIKKNPIFMESMCGISRRKKSLS